MAPPVEEYKRTSESAPVPTTSQAPASRATFVMVLIGLLIAGTLFLVFAYNVSQGPDENPIPSPVPLNQGQQAPTGPTGSAGPGAFYAADVDKAAVYSNGERNTSVNPGNNNAEQRSSHDQAMNNAHQEEFAERARAEREDEIRRGNTLQRGSLQTSQQDEQSSAAPPAMQFPLDALQAGSPLSDGSGPDAVISQGTAGGGARVNITPPFAAPVNPRFVVPLLGLPPLPATGTLEMAPVNQSGHVVTPIPVRTIPPFQAGVHKGTRNSIYGGNNTAVGGGGIFATPGTAGGPPGYFAPVIQQPGLSGSGGTTPGAVRTVPILPPPMEFAPRRSSTITRGSGSTTTTTTTNSSGTTTTTRTGPPPTTP